MSEKNIYFIISEALTQKKGTGCKMHIALCSATLVVNIFCLKKYLRTSA
jgi:hypothetical protein